MHRKYLITASIMVLMLATTTGCGKQTGENQNTALPLESETENQIFLPSVKDELDNAVALPSESSKTNNQGRLPSVADESDNSTTPSDENGETDNAPNILPISANQYTTIIGGKVRSVAQDSFVISRTLWEDSDDGGSYILMPEEGSPEEELVTIHCSDTTTFERWTI